MAHIAFDTNVLGYAAKVGHGEADRVKAMAAEELLSAVLAGDVLVLPAQVCVELHNLLVRKRGLARDHAARIVEAHMASAVVVQSDKDIVASGFALSTCHQLQTFDAVILAACAAGGCATLYSEDMQDGFEWEGVRIVNPFAIK